LKKLWNQRIIGFHERTGQKIVGFHERTDKDPAGNLKQVVVVVVFFFPVFFRKNKLRTAVSLCITQLGI